MSEIAFIRLDNPGLIEEQGSVSFSLDGRVLLCTTDEQGVLNYSKVTLRPSGPKIDAAVLYQGGGYNVRQASFM